MELVSSHEHLLFADGLGEAPMDLGSSDEETEQVEDTCKYRIFSFFNKTIF